MAGQHEVLLFCVDEAYPSGTPVLINGASLNVKGEQVASTSVRYPTPDGSIGYYFPTICVHQLSSTTNIN
jgi:hypothetical protein